MLSDNKKYLISAWSLTMLYYLPIMMASVYYRDDLERSFGGYFGWAETGRPGAEFLFSALTLSTDKSLDIFPYSIILSASFIALSAYFVMVLLNRNNIKHASFISFLFIFNPFYLQNVSYRYDSFGMSLAVLLTVYSYVFLHKNKLLEMVITAILLTAGLSIYQQCSNIFIALVGVELLSCYKHNSIKQCIYRCINRVSCYILAWVFYVFVIAKLFNRYTGRAELIKFDSNAFNALYENLHMLLELVSSYFNEISLYLFLILIISCVLTIIIKTVNDRDITKTAFVLIMSLFAFLISLMGPSILLLNAPVVPRSLVSFSILYILIAIPMSYSSARIIYLSIIPAFVSMTFSAKLGNFYSIQNKFEDVVFTQLSYDLSKIKGVNSIEFSGSVSLSPRAKIYYESTPLLSYFQFPATQWMAAYKLKEKLIDNVASGYGSEKKNTLITNNLISKNSRPISSSSSYDIYVNDATAFVRFK
ncbi:putative glucosyltransferase domain-containing protein [Hafnia phage vB_HpaM_Meifeng]|nr:putative glucosyltransferase domain-containing protein [Hafnia phage vB_HpaM_Meifeng]